MAGTESRRPKRRAGLRGIRQNGLRTQNVAWPYLMGCMGRGERNRMVPPAGFRRIAGLKRPRCQRHNPMMPCGPSSGPGHISLRAMRGNAA